MRTMSAVGGLQIFELTGTGNYTIAWDTPLDSTVRIMARPQPQCGETDLPSEQEWIQCGGTSFNVPNWCDLFGTRMVEVSAQVFASALHGWSEYSEIVYGKSDCTEPPFNLIIEAEDMIYHANGAQRDDYWLLWSNGTMSQDIDFPETGTYRFEITARGSLAEGIGPEMELIIDGEIQSTVFVNNTDPDTFVFEIEVIAGTREFAIGFYNDYYDPPEDRNLYVDKTHISSK